MAFYNFYNLLLIILVIVILVRINRYNKESKDNLKNLEDKIDRLQKFITEQKTPTSEPAVVAAAPGTRFPGRVFGRLCIRFLPW